MVTVLPGEPEIIAEPYDAIVVVGLAFRGTTQEGVVYGRGAAYYSQPRGRAKRIYEELGLDPIEKTAIPEPIDTYFWKGKPFGPELKTFLDSYSQSALGGRTEDVNAMAFANFYLAEIETRYAWPGGTAGAAVHMVAKLEAHNKTILRTGTAVTKVKNVEGGVEVTWIEGGKARRAKAKA